jgi:nicotinate phosphoribosyltransferase
MSTDPKRRPHREDYDRAKRARKRQEEALDDALKNTFPASDPVSIEQPGPPDADHNGQQNSSPDGDRRGAYC